MTAQRLHLEDERGGISPFLVILFAALVGFTGLAYDGGQLFAARREANNIAAASARAGANDVDEASIYAGTPQLAATAPATAQNFAAAQGVATAPATPLDPFRVQVEVTTTYEPTFLGAFGIGTQTISGIADARIGIAVTSDG